MNDSKEIKKTNKSINQHSKIDYTSDYQSDEDLKKVFAKRPKSNFSYINQTENLPINNALKISENSNENHTNWSSKKNIKKIQD